MDKGLPDLMLQNLHPNTYNSLNVIQKERKFLNVLQYATVVDFVRFFCLASSSALLPQA